MRASPGYFYFFFLQNPLSICKVVLIRPVTSICLLAFLVINVYQAPYPSTKQFLSPWTFNQSDTDWSQMANVHKGKFTFNKCILKT